MILNDMNDRVGLYTVGHSIQFVQGCIQHRGL